MAYTPKSQLNDNSVIEFIKKLNNEKQKEQALKLLSLFEEASSAKGKMWGDSIIGFGSYHYRYESGQEGDWMRGGFSPRKGKFS